LIFFRGESLAKNEVIMMLTDEHLAKLVENAIRRDERVYLQPIEVSVNDGIVTLDGTVRSHRRKLVAYEIASSFEGCRDVVNKLAVDPETPPPDKEVVKNVVSSLNANADIVEGTINVAVADGVASLTGTVKGDWERFIAEDVALSAKGVRGVENKLIVDPILGVYGEQLAKGMKTALDQARGLKGAAIEVEISGRTVVLLGVVHMLSEKETAEIVVRRFGLQNIRNEIVVKQ
jgi:osmotically-inducible protein OsmY